MTVKERLEAYRRKKDKEEMAKSIMNVIRNVFSWKHNDGADEPNGSKEEQVQLCMKSTDVENAENTEDSWMEDEVQESKSTVITKATYLLYFLLWVTLYMIALEYEFGAIYFILSALAFIWLNTRSGPKKLGEPSAYSVFNPNCEAIEGTLDASQFEREIRYGIGGVR